MSEDISNILNSLDSIPLENIRPATEADETEKDICVAADESMPPDWGLDAETFDMPDSIQQSIEALMKDTVEQVDSQYHINVSFREEGTQELYTNRETDTALGADAGWDLHCTKDTVIQPGETVFIDFGLGVSCTMDGGTPIPLLLMPRSSISKTPLRLANSVGLIDAGYRGNLKAAVDHRGTEPYTIKRGDRLFQLVAMPTQGMRWSTVSELDVTERGDGGFGSTGR